jgi:acetyl-CoA C-acetyltransferase
MSTSYVMDAARTARPSRRARALSGIRAELFAQVLQALVARGAVRRDVDDVIAEMRSRVGEQGANLARNAVLAAGWPIEVSATTVNRFCGSGLSAVHFAAMGVASGAMDFAVAGGVESMSRVPMGSDGGGTDGNNPHLRERFFQVPQGISADLIATLEGFSRAELDEVALRSQRNAARAIEETASRVPSCRWSMRLPASRPPARREPALDTQPRG